MIYCGMIEKIQINIITCMEMKLFIPYHASKIMFYNVYLACYHYRTSLGDGCGAHLFRCGPQVP